LDWDGFKEVKDMRIKLFIIGVLFNFLFIPGLCRGDESDIFTVTAQPDVLILLDLSESMNLNPEGKYCYTRNCTRLAMAKAAIREILDANKDGQINSQDEQTLATRIGYMRFYNCKSDDTDGSYTKGCNTIQNPIPNTDSTPFPSPSGYAQIWSNVNAEKAGGSTPAASALNEARLYLDFHKNQDRGSACRNKYVILVTDGEDTFACNGNGLPAQNDMYKRRKAVVAKAKALSDAGYEVFVIGFGTGPPITEGPRIFRPPNPGTLMQFFLRLIPAGKGRPMIRERLPSRAMPSWRPMPPKSPKPSKGSS
jgi:hypothetical protein